MSIIISYCNWLKLEVPLCDSRLTDNTNNELISITISDCKLFADNK